MKKSIKSYALYTGIGMGLSMEILVAGAIGWFLGNRADLKWGLGPWGTITGIFLFLGLGLFHVARMLIDLQNKVENTPDEDEEKV